MQIKKLEVKNFCGIDGGKEFTPEKIIVLLGANGTGKTTLLNAVRYALTGEEPAGPIIHVGKELCEVSITLVDPATGEDIQFTRIKQEEKPSKFKIDGKSTTLKALSEKLESVIGIPLEKVSVTSSSELIAAMKPQDFSSFILDYIPKKSTLADVIALIPDSTIEMLEILEKNLPEEDITMEKLDAFEKLCKTVRTDLKGILANKSALYATMPQENPGFNKSLLKKRMLEIQGYAGEKALYVQKLSAYNKAVETHTKYEKTIAELKEKIAASKAERPNPAHLTALQEKRDSLSQSIQNQKIAIAGAYTATQQLRITLEALEKPICPVSPLITCHQDKTVAKEDISEAIKSSEEGIAALNDELIKAEAGLKDIGKDIEAYNANAAAYNDKLSWAKQVKTLEDALPDIPAKPTPVKEIDVSAEEAKVKSDLALQEKFEEGLVLAEQIANITAELNTYEKLCKIFAEKGPVKTGIMAAFLKVFEDICNERSTKFRPDITFSFRNEDGIMVYMSNGKKDKDGTPLMLPYKALSGGEKAYMLFILMDMLNQLTGTRLMFLDELNIMDKDVLSALLDIVTNAKAEYDHIFLAAVNHKDIEDIFSEKEI